jgi:hypothetical protein
MEKDAFTGKVIGCMIEVHKALGPGLQKARLRVYLSMVPRCIIDRLGGIYIRDQGEDICLNYCLWERHPAAISHSEIINTMPIKIGSKNLRRGRRSKIGQYYLITTKTYKRATILDTG